MYRVGVDLGGTNIAVGIIDEECRMIDQISVPTLAKRPEDAVIKDICKTVGDVLQRQRISACECSSIGVGAPGCCDSEKGIVFRSYSLSWNHVPLGERMQKYFPIPVKVDNDANCAALAEALAGAGRGYKNTVLVTLGTGIGTGIVLDGKIYSGLKGNGTEFGHTMIDVNGELCSCGRRGCWDAYASATALIVNAKKAAANRPESALNLVDEMNGKAVFDIAGQGDVTAIAVVREYCYYLAVGISNIINVFGPDIIIVGGGISRQGDKILDPVRRYVRENCFDKREEAMPHITTAHMGNDAGIIGAALL